MVTKQQQPAQPSMPMEHDGFWGNVNNPAWQAEQRAKFAARQAARQAELAQAQQAEAQRQAQRQAEQAEHQAFLKAAHQRREAFARGEIGPVDPAKVIPTLAAVFEPSRLAAQAAKEEEHRKINESVRWPGLPLQERIRREKYELVNHTTWPE